MRARTYCATHGTYDDCLRPFENEANGTMRDGELWEKFCVLMTQAITRAAVFGEATIRLRVSGETIDFELEGLHAESVGNSGSTPDDATDPPPMLRPPPDAEGAGR